jgi:hypothetical protein
MDASAFARRGYCASSRVVGAVHGGDAMLAAFDTAVKEFLAGRSVNMKICQKECGS